MRCELAWSSSRLTVQTSGTCSRQELLGGIREVTADTRYDRLRHVIIDFLDLQPCASGFLDAVEDILVVMIGASANNPNVRVAVLTSDAHIIALVEALNAPPHGDQPMLACFADRARVAGWTAEAAKAKMPSIRFRPR